MTQFDEVIAATGYSEFHREKILPYYNDGLEFLRDAGVPEELVTSSKAVGCLARYVMETMNLNSTAVDLSPFFFKRLKQLQLAEVPDARNETG